MKDTDHCCECNGLDLSEYACDARHITSIMRVHTAVRCPTATESPSPPEPLQKLQRPALLWLLTFRLSLMYSGRPQVAVGAGSSATSDFLISLCYPIPESELPAGTLRVE